MAANENKGNTALATNEANQGVSVYESIVSYSDLLSFADSIKNTPLVPASFKTKEAIAAVILAGRELNVPPMAALNNIHNIDGRCTQSVHLITAILLKNGITYEVESDFELTPVTVISKNGKIPVSYFIKNSDEFQVVTKDTKESAFKADKTQVIVSYETSTVIIFHREMKLPSGSWSKMTYKSVFTFAQLRTLTDKKDGTERDNVLKQPETMLFTRCFTKGARRIANDLLLGMYEHTEIMDLKEVSYEIVDDGTVIINQDIKDK